MKSGPIIVVEDDEDDKDILQEILVELKVPNKLIWFNRSADAFHYLKTTSDQPFVIISDVNLPVETGIEFKGRIDADPQLRHKSIPFLFYSTSVDKHTVTQAYTQLTVQGFFQKPNQYEDIKAQFRLIVEYWNFCRHPNSDG